MATTPPRMGVHKCTGWSCNLSLGVHVVAFAPIAEPHCTGKPRWASRRWRGARSWHPYRQMPCHDIGMQRMSPRRFLPGGMTVHIVVHVCAVRQRGLRRMSRWTSLQPCTDHGAEFPHVRIRRLLMLQRRLKPPLKPHRRTVAHYGLPARCGPGDLARRSCVAHDVHAAAHIASLSGTRWEAVLAPGRREAVWVVAAATTLPALAAHRNADERTFWLTRLTIALVQHAVVRLDVVGFVFHRLLPACILDRSWVSRYLAHAAARSDRAPFAASLCEAANRGFDPGGPRHQHRSGYDGPSHGCKLGERAARFVDAAAASGRAGFTTSFAEVANAGWGPVRLVLCIARNMLVLLVAMLSLCTLGCAAWLGAGSVFHRGRVMRGDRYGTRGHSAVYAGHCSGGPTMHPVLLALLFGTLVGYARADCDAGGVSGDPAASMVNRTRERNDGHSQFELVSINPNAASTFCDLLADGSMPDTADVFLVQETKLLPTAIDPFRDKLGRVSYEAACNPAFRTDLGGVSCGTSIVWRASQWATGPAHDVIPGRANVQRFFFRGFGHVSVASYYGPVDATPEDHFEYWQELVLYLLGCGDHFVCLLYTSPSPRD